MPQWVAAMGRSFMFTSSAIPVVVHLLMKADDPRSVSRACVRSSAGPACTHWSALMGLSLKPDHLRRYRDIAALLLSTADPIWCSMPVPLIRGRDASESCGDATSRPISNVWVRRSSRSASCCPPAPTCCRRSAARRSSRLQDDVEPFPFADVDRIVTEELGRATLEGVLTLRRHAARRRIARPGAPRRAARRPRGRGQGPASRRPRAGARRHGDARRGGRLSRPPHRDRAAASACSRMADGAARVAAARARLPPRSAQHDCDRQPTSRASRASSCRSRSPDCSTSAC